MNWVSCQCTPEERGMDGGSPTDTNCRRCGLPALPLGRFHRLRTPRDYTPHHLADRILSSRSALEGQRKLVTVLFVDVKGSMELADEIDAEVLHDIMDRFFAVLSEGIHRFQGTINQFTGDGIMALFGAPIAHEDHAQRACYAALYLNDELRRYSAELKRSLGVTFSVRMGLNSGEVVVGSIGDDLRMDYTAQGNTVGLAARMEQLADSGTIYLSEETARQVAGFFHLRDLGLFEIKGLRRTIKVHDLQGIGPHKSRLDRSHARGLTNFIGRDEEMHVLETALDRAMKGNAQVVGVIAEAGIGKSRLCLEFAKRCVQRGIHVREGHAHAHGQLTPFMPVLEMLRSLFGIHANEDPGESRKKIAGATLLLEPSLVAGLPLLFEFLGVPDPDEPPLPLDPNARQRRLLGIITRLFHAKNRRESSVVLIEDLHWLDAGSELFLEKFVESIAGTRTLLLINFRPDYHAPWMNRSHYQQLPLAPLDDDSVAEFLSQLLGNHPSVRELPEAIHKRCDGNPFFLEEVIQSLVDSGKLVGSRETYQLMTPIEHITVPHTVHSVLDARIDQLSDQEKYTLQSAAIIGSKFPEALLLRVISLSAVELATSLQTLIRLEFIYECTLYPATEFAFVHPLTQEVAYGCQLKESRARIHYRVASALEELHPHNLGEQAALLAHHWEEAGETNRAIAWHRRAAEWIGLRNIAEAHCHWRIVLALIGDEVDSPGHIQTGLTARIWLLQLAWRLGFSPDEATRIFNRGIELSRLADDALARTTLTLCYAIFRGVIGDQHGNVRFASEAAGLADELGAVGLGRAARLSILMSLLYQGDLEGSVKMLAQMNREPGGGSDRLYMDDALTHEAYRVALSGMLHALIGKFTSAAIELRKTAELADQLPEPETRGYLHSFCSQAAVLSGNIEAALHHGRHSAQLAEETEIPLQLADGFSALGEAQVLAEQWPEAIKSLHRALDVMEERKNLAAERPHVFAILASAYLGSGATDKALTCLDDVLSESNQQVPRIIELNARITRVRALLRCPTDADPDTIQREISLILGLINDTGAEAYRPKLHLLMAEVAACAEDPENEVLHLRAAHRVCVEMGAKGHARSIAATLGETHDSRLRSVS